MNKTININLGGLFFHIDENAYHKLTKYLNAIRKSLSDDPQGKEEIIKDIESRISELLAERVVDERQVVSEQDIDEIVDIMGQPEDYNVDDETTFDKAGYRPKSSRATKKLFRDGDDRFLGGVAAGTAHYVGIEPIWSRILWLIFAFGFGFGFIVYPLLWILLPVAKTTAEKLEMEGERVNIDNIEKKIREEFNTVSEKVKEGANDLNEKIQNAGIKKKAKSGLQEFLDTVGSVILTLLKVFAKFIGILIVFIAAITLISLVIGFFSWGSIEYLGIDNEFMRIHPRFIDSTMPYWLLIICAFIVVAVPFIVLFMLGLKILSNNAKSFGKVTGLTLLALWILSILGIIFTTIDVSSRYSHSGISTTKHELAIEPTDTLSISMLKLDEDNVVRYDDHRINKIYFDSETKKMFSRKVSVDVRLSDQEYAYVKIRKSARGKNFEIANDNASKLEYEFKLDNKNLKLNNYFLKDYLSQSIFEEDVDVIVYVPEGYHVYLDRSTKYYLDDVDNVQNIYDRNMVDHYYIMGNEELDCLDCPDSTTKVLEDEHVKLKIDDKSFNLKINTTSGESTEISLDKNGMKIS